jgi:hypothetical protein
MPQGMSQYGAPGGARGGSPGGAPGGVQGPAPDRVPDRVPDHAPERSPEHGAPRVCWKCVFLSGFKRKQHLANWRTIWGTIWGTISGVVLAVFGEFLKTILRAAALANLKMAAWPRGRMAIVLGWLRKSSPNA